MTWKKTIILLKKKEDKMRDYQVKNFKDLDEVETFFGQQNEQDVWVRLRTRDLVPVGLNDEPLFVDQIMSENNTDMTDADAVRECMNDQKLMLEFPYGDKQQVVPLRYTALKTLCDRAGISGMSIMSFDNRPHHSQITPDERAQILSIMLQHFRNKSLLLVRDGKVSAVLSGDPKDYTIMPVCDLLEIVQEEMDYRFQKYSFLSGQATHEMVRIVFGIQDDKIRAKANLIANTKSEPDIQMEFVSSDVGKNSATLIPTVRINGVVIRIGPSLRLRHKSCDLKAFEKMCQSMFSMFETGLEQMEKLSQVSVANPEKTLEKIADGADLPLVSLKRAVDVMLQETGGKCSAFDVYYYIYWLIDDYEMLMDEKGKSLSLQQKFDMQEKAARQLRAFA